MTTTRQRYFTPLDLKRELEAPSDAGLVNGVDPDLMDMSSGVAPGIDTRPPSQAPPGGWPTEPFWGVKAPPRIDLGGPSPVPTPRKGPSPLDPQNLLMKPPPSPSNWQRFRTWLRADQGSDPTALYQAAISAGQTIAANLPRTGVFARIPDVRRTVDSPLGSLLGSQVLPEGRDIQDVSSWEFALMNVGVPGVSGVRAGTPLFAPTSHLRKTAAEIVMAPAKMMMGMTPGEGGGGVAKVVKQPWQMTYKELIASTEGNALGTPERATVAKLLRDFNEARGYEYPRPFNPNDKITTTTASQAHRASIEQALAEGKNIPPQVLADYPEMGAAKFTLPKPLAGLKPRGIGGVPLEFESDLDKTLYTLANKKTLSVADEQYMKAVMDHTGLTREEVRAAGVKVKQQINSLVLEAKSGETVRVPDLTTGVGKAAPKPTPESVDQFHADLDAAGIKWDDTKPGAEPFVAAQKAVTGTAKIEKLTAPKLEQWKDTLRQVVAENAGATQTVEEMRHMARQIQAGLLEGLARTAKPEDYRALQGDILRGKLPDMIGSGKLKDAPQEVQRVLYRTVMDSGLQPFEKMSASEGLRRAFAGERTTPTMDRHLLRVLDPEAAVAKAIEDIPKTPEALRPGKPPAPVQDHVPVLPPPELTPEEIRAVEVTPKVAEKPPALPEPSARMKAGKANIDLARFRTEEVGPGLGMTTEQRAANAKARIDKMEQTVRGALPKSPEQAAGVPAPEGAIPAQVAPLIDLLESFTGRAPTRAEIAQATGLARVARGAGGGGAPPPTGIRLPTGGDIARNALSIYGLSRALLTGFDTGITLLRQGFLLSWGNPRLAARSTKGAVNWILHEDFAMSRNEFIQESELARVLAPYHPSLLADLPKAGPLLPGEGFWLRRVLRHVPGMESLAEGALTKGRLAAQARQLEIEAAAAKGLRQGGVMEEARAISRMEEAFPTRLAGALPVLRQSNRGYTGFLNEFRYQKGTRMLEAMKLQGRTSEKDLRELARFLGDFTGRAHLGMLEDHAAFLSQGFFSPRSMVALFRAPMSVFASNPVVRKEAIKDIMAAIAGTTALLTVLKLSGLVDVETDPRSSDYGKVRLGNIRIDVTGGYQKVIRTAWQLITDESKSVDKRGETAITATTKVETGLRFTRGKLAPGPATLVDFLSGSTMIGEEVTPSTGGAWTAVQRAYTPITATTLYQAAKEEGLLSPGFLASFVLPNIGGGVDTFASLSAQLTKWLASQPPIDQYGEPVPANSPTRAAYWSDLNPGVVAQFRLNDPGVKALYEAAAKDQQTKALRDLTEQAHREQSVADEHFLAGLTDSRHWEGALINRAIESGARQGLRKVMGLVPEANSPQRRLLEGYYALMDLFGQPDGSVDTAALADAQDAYLKGRTPAEVKYIETALHPNATPLVKEYWAFRKNLRDLDWNHIYQETDWYKALNGKARGIFDGAVDFRLKGGKPADYEQTLLTEHGKEGPAVVAMVRDLNGRVQKAQKAARASRPELDYEMARFRGTAPSNLETQQRLAKEVQRPEQLPRLLVNNGQRVTARDLVEIRLLLGLNRVPTLEDIANAPPGRLGKYAVIQGQARALLGPSSALQRKAA